MFFSSLIRVARKTAVKLWPIYSLRALCGGFMVITSYRWWLYSSAGRNLRWQKSNVFSYNTFNEKKTNITFWSLGLWIVGPLSVIFDEIISHVSWTHRMDIKIHVFDTKVRSASGTEIGPNIPNNTYTKKWVSWASYCFKPFINFFKFM